MWITEGNLLICKMLSKAAMQAPVVYKLQTKKLKMHSAQPGYAVFRIWEFSFRTAP